jgi:hypothetical protein
MSRVAAAVETTLGDTRASLTAHKTLVDCFIRRETDACDGLARNISLALLRYPNGLASMKERDRIRLLEQAWFALFTDPEPCVDLERFEEALKNLCELDMDGNFCDNKERVIEYLLNHRYFSLLRMCYFLSEHADVVLRRCLLALSANDLAVDKYDAVWRLLYMGASTPNLARAVVDAAITALRKDPPVSWATFATHALVKHISAFVPSSEDQMIYLLQQDIPASLVLAMKLLLETRNSTLQAARNNTPTRL